MFLEPLSHAGQAVPVLDRRRPLAVVTGIDAHAISVRLETDPEVAGERVPKHMIALGHLPG